MGQGRDNGTQGSIGQDGICGTGQGQWDRAGTMGQVRDSGAERTDIGQGTGGTGRGGVRVVAPRWPGHTHRRALCQLVRGHHLHVEVLGLGLPPGLDEPLQHLDTRGQLGVTEGTPQRGREGLTLPGPAATLGEVILM